MGAATHRSATTPAVHCGARSLVRGLNGGSGLPSPLHFPEGYATPSASPCSNLLAEEASPPLRARLQSGAGDCGMWELSRAPGGGTAAQARGAGQARWTLAGGYRPLFCPWSRSRFEAAGGWVMWGEGGGPLRTSETPTAVYVLEPACGSPQTPLSPVNSRACS